MRGITELDIYLHRGIFEGGYCSASTRSIAKVNGKISFMTIDWNDAYRSCDPLHSKR